MNLLLALASGLLFGLAFPDAGVGWLAFIALAPLLVAVTRAKTKGRAFLLGWLSQFVAWLIMVPWVVRVMSHYGGLPYAVGVAAFVAMTSVLGLYGGAFAAIVKRIDPGPSFVRWLLVPLAWAALEYARTYLLTGFPWNLIAAAIVDYTSLVQIDRFAGPYFLGALVVFPSAVLAWWITQRPRGTQRLLVGGVVGILALVWPSTGYVASKLFARAGNETVAHAALLQPNISQEMRWDNENLLNIYQRMMTMTDAAVAHHSDVIIWPESTVPLSFATTSFYRDSIEGASRQSGADIILGSVAEDPSQPNKLWNAAFLVSGGRTIGHYDKIRLVPFGEYVPLRKMLFFAEKLVHAVGDFQFGARDTPLVGQHHYGPAICYEIVYPQIPRTQVVHGADVLVTITNDAWYDGTSAPRQHLNQARLRAIETDRYLLRSGTTGISAFVDPTGRVLQELAMGRQGIIYADFQPRHSTTPYVRFGDWFSWLACAVVVVFGLRRQSRRFRQSAKAAAPPPQSKRKVHQ